MRSYRTVTGKLVRLYVCMVVVGFGAAVLGVAEIAAAGKSPASHGFQHVYVSWDLPAGFAFMLIGGFLLRFRVAVSKDRLTTYNVPSARRAAREEIAAIELRTKPWGILTGPTPVRVPYVRLKNGSGFWLYPLAGNGATLAPQPKQLAMLSEIRARRSCAGFSGGGAAVTAAQQYGTAPGLTVLMG
jgi:hypothetical protein